MTPPAPMTVEGFLEKWHPYPSSEGETEMRQDLESMLLSAERRGEAKGMREAAKITDYFCFRNMGCVPCEIKKLIQQKADSLEKEGG